MIAWIDAGGDRAELGGKGAGLAFLAGAGVRIPRGFAVTVSAFRQALPPDLLRRVEARATAAPEGASLADLEQVAAGIRELVLTETARHPLMVAVAAAYDELCADEVDAAVAVRSSSAAEDAGDRSFAGEHDSYLWVRGADEVAQRVRECWASLFTARAIAYRRGAPAAAMAVVVQRMVPARSAGVVMSLNPVNGDRSKVVVESVWGLGEPLVQGVVNPDRFVLDKVTGEVCRREVADKPTEMVCDPVSGCGTVVRDVDAARREQPSLTSDELRELVRLARLVEQRAGCPQDAEFAVTDGPSPENVVVVQCRPVTTVPARPPVGGGASALQAIVATLSGSRQR